MRRFGIVGFLLGVLLLGGVGVIAYQMGVAAGTSAAAVAAGSTVVYAPGGWGWGWGFGFGFPFFGLLFGFLFLGLVLAIVRRAAFGRGGWGGWGGARGGPGYGPDAGAWGGDDRGSWAGSGDRPVPPPVDAMLGRWHREAHATAAAETPTSPGAPGTTPATGPAQAEASTGRPQG